MALSMNLVGLKNKTWMPKQVNPAVAMATGLGIGKRLKPRALALSLLFPCQPT